MTDNYEIRIEGHLSPQWCEWLGNFEITNLEHGETLLIGAVRDQAALQDLLGKIRDMNLNIISVIRIDFNARSDDDELEEDPHGNS